MADKDPSRQIITGPEGRADHESSRLRTASGATRAEEKPSKHIQDVGEEVDELSIEQPSLPSASQPVRRAPMTDKDPNRQIITDPEGRVGHGSSRWKTVLGTSRPEKKPSNPMQDVPEEVDELSIEQPSLPSAPQPVRRAPMTDKDPNRQIITDPEDRVDHGSSRWKTVSGATHAEKQETYACLSATPSTRSSINRIPQQASHVLVATQPCEPLFPPLTQSEQQVPPRKVRRKKAAPGTLPHGSAQHRPQEHQQNDANDENLRPKGFNARHSLQQPAISRSIERNDVQPHPIIQNFNTSFTMDQEDPCSAQLNESIDANRGVVHNGGSANATGGIPARHGPEPQMRPDISPERAQASDNSSGEHQRPMQARPSPPDIASLPFPDLASASTRRNSPKPVNRPLPASDLQATTATHQGPVNAAGRVVKRKKTSTAKNVVAAPIEHSTVTGVYIDTDRMAIDQEQHDNVNRPEIRQEQCNFRSENTAPAQRAPAVNHVLSAPAFRTSGLSPLEAIDQAKNMMVAQVQQKDLELGELKAEVNRLEQTVEVLKGNVNKLEGDKAKLRGIMQKKCSSLQEKVGELLKDHQAVGHFVEKTSMDIAKFNKYREKSGSVFKAAISNYSDLQLHQKKTMEAIQETRLRVANDISDLTKAHNHESGIVLRDLQAEKKKVADLEKVLDAEKEKVKNLENRLQSGVNDDIKALLEKQNETFAAKIESNGRELLGSFDAKQEERSASLKDYLKTLQTYKEHETEASKTIAELLSQIAALSANVSQAMKLKDETFHGLQNAGEEILNTIKEKVESISEVQSHQAELSSRVLLLETTKINLESLLKAEEKSKLEVETQLRSKTLQIEQNLEQLRLKDQHVQALQSSLQQETQRMQQEAGKLRSTLAAVNEEVLKLKESSAKLQEDNENLLMQVSCFKNESESVSERLRTLQEAVCQTSETLKASENEKARLLIRAQAAERKGAEVQAKFSEYAANAIERFKEQELNAEKQLAEQVAHSKQQLEAQRIKMDEERRRAVREGRQGALAELSTLKKLFENLKAEKLTLEDSIAVDSEKDELRTEISRILKEKAGMERSHASEKQKYQRAFISQSSEIQSMKELIQQSARHLTSVGEQVNQLENLSRSFSEGYEKLEASLVHHEDVELKIRAYCQAQGWDYNDMDVSSFLSRFTKKAVEAYRHSLTSSSFTSDVPCPSTSFSQSMTIATIVGSQTQPSQSASTSAAPRQKVELSQETLQVSGTQTPRRNRCSPSFPVAATRASYAVTASPIKTRRNHSIAERRRTQTTSSAKPPTPDTSETPVRKPSDRTTGSGGHPGNRPGPPSFANATFEIPDSSQEPSQKRAHETKKAAPRGQIQAESTPTRPFAESKRVDSEFSDLTDLLDMMDQSPEVDVIPVLEQQRLQRASSTAEDSQSQRSKATVMEPPSTPREPKTAPAHEPKKLKGILKKRTHSMASQVEESPAQAPPRRHLQPLKGKNSLASLGTGSVGFRSSQDAGPSRSVGFSAGEAGETHDTAVATQVGSTRPNNVTTGRGLKRTQTIRRPTLATESEPQSTPVVKKPRLSIPYKPSSSQKK